MYPVTPCQGSSNNVSLSRHTLAITNVGVVYLPTVTEHGLDTQVHVSYSVRIKCTYLKSDCGGDSIGFSSESSIH